MSHKSDNQGLFDNPNVVKWILRIFYIICAVLVLIDLVVHRHIYTDIEKIPAFYALYGFVACVLLVFAAKWLRSLLMRSETYYDPEADRLTDQKQEKL